MEWAPEATPQAEDEARCAPPCPEVVDAAIDRGIARIVHFTRMRPGFVGILDSSAIKARRQLPEEQRLRHVYKPNAVDRSRDHAWHGYVNLSVTTINRRMFRSSKSWHPEAEWVILGFGPEILGDPGVVFCTTNNAYPVVRRSAELRGFDQMFAPEVPWGYEGSVSIRGSRQPHQTTDPQAEILYPSALSLDHLRTVTVSDDATLDAAEAALGVLDRPLRRKLDIVLETEALL